MTEFFRVEGVKAHIHGFKPESRKTACGFLQHCAVGGHCDAESGKLLPDLLQERHKTLSHKGFPSCKPDFLYPELHKNLTEKQYVLVRHNLFVGNPFHTFGRHAVAAPVIAPVRHRNAGVFEYPSVRVLHYSGHL